MIRFVSVTVQHLGVRVGSYLALDGWRGWGGGIGAGGTSKRRASGSNVEDSISHNTCIDVDSKQH